MDIDPDVEKRLLPIEEELAELRKMTGAIALFAARDNLETALFSAMQGMTDAEQVGFLETLTAHIKGN